MRILNSNFLSSPINRGVFFQEGAEKFRNHKNLERKILGRKSNGDFVWEKRFHNKRKSFIKSPCKFSKLKKNCCTRIFLNLTSSFENKPLVALDWYSKSIKHHRCSSSCGQSERIGEKIFFVKNIMFEIVPTIFLISINILFALFLLFSLHRKTIYEICAYKFLAHPMGHLYLSYLLLEDWSLPCQWHLKEHKLCMSSRAMTKLSLHNWHTTTLRPHDS